jgi:hypothetical protein
MSQENYYKNQIHSFRAIKLKRKMKNNRSRKHYFTGFMTRLAYILLISFCHYISGSAQNPKPIIIHPSQNRLPVLNSSQLIKNINFIPLETTSDNLIGSVSKIIRTADKFFVLDQYKAKKIFVFDLKGRFLDSIGNRGKGPGEYSNISDFTIDEQRQVIYLIDDGLKIIKLGINGDFIFEKKLDSVCRNISDIIASEGLIFASPGRRPGHDKKYDLIQFDENLNPVRWFLPYQYSFPGTNPFNNRLYKYNNSIYFVSAYDNKIYYLTANSISERFIFDTEGKELDLKDLTSEKYVENKTGVYLFHNCVEGDEIIFVPIFYQGWPRFGFIEKKTNKYFLVDKINKDPIPLFQFSSFYNGRFFTTLNSNVFLKTFPDSKIDIEITDNPVIIEYQISFRNK